MRFLLISDTHENLGIINELAARAARLLGAFQAYGRRTLQTFVTR